MPRKQPLRSRLAAWEPPEIDLSAKPRGAVGRVFPASITAIRGGGFRPGLRPT